MLREYGGVKAHAFRETDPAPGEEVAVRSRGAKGADNYVVLYPSGDFRPAEPAVFPPEAFPQLGEMAEQAPSWRPELAGQIAQSGLAGAKLAAARRQNRAALERQGDNCRQTNPALGDADQTRRYRRPLAKLQALQERRTEMEISPEPGKGSPAAPSNPKTGG